MAFVTAFNAEVGRLVAVSSPPIASKPLNNESGIALTEMNL